EHKLGPAPEAALQARRPRRVGLDDPNARWRIEKVERIGHEARMRAHVHNRQGAGRKDPGEVHGQIRDLALAQAPVELAPSETGNPPREEEQQPAFLQEEAHVQALGGRIDAAGTPATTSPGATSRSTTAPAPMMALSPIVTPGRTTEC